MAGGGDKLLFVVGTHRVMHDRLQIVLQHPKDCRFKGSPLDKRKTFHPLRLALPQLQTCGVALTPEQERALTAQGQVCEAAPR